MDLLNGVRARPVSTDRLNAFIYESGPADGIPVVMIHGNLSTGRFYEHLWPGVAAGTRGILNALSGKYCNWSNIVDLDPKPPVLWTHGSADIVIADGSAWEMGTLGQAGFVPGWPGADVFPPQLMVSQIRNVLDQYQGAGGRVEMEMFEGSGHAPQFDAAQDWAELFFEFLASVE